MWTKILKGVFIFFVQRYTCLGIILKVPSMTLQSSMKAESVSSPFSPYLFLLRGSAFAGNGDYDSAIDDFNSAIKLDGTNPIFYWARGHAYDENSNDVGAIDDYTQGISLMNSSGTRQVTFGIQSIDVIDLYEARSENYEKNGNYDKAIADLQEVVKLSNDAEKRQDANKQIQELRAKKGLP
jgi:tetratricopeptide (TPR) repeat protein